MIASGWNTDNTTDAIIIARRMDDAMVATTLRPNRSLTPCQPDIVAEPSAHVALTIPPMIIAKTPNPVEPSHVAGSNILTMM